MFLTFTFHRSLGIISPTTDPLLGDQSSPIAAPRANQQQNCRKKYISVLCNFFILKIFWKLKMTIVELDLIQNHSRIFLPNIMILDLVIWRNQIIHVIGSLLKYQRFLHFLSSLFERCISWKWLMADYTGFLPPTNSAHSQKEREKRLSEKGKLQMERKCSEGQWQKVHEKGIF